MNLVFILLLSVLCFSWANSVTTTTPTPPEPKVWALLMAGSNGWHNYRHQADICKAYQLLKSNGIPERNIILMMYDDIAYNPKNPHPGVIINELNGPNVYEGVVKDYTSKNVTIENFFNVLQGKKEAMNGIGSGRVIESGPDDYIFLDFVGYGSDEILIFPNNEILTSDQLFKGLNELVKNNRFAKMFIFVDAPDSGSVFDDLEDDKNIFVMTSSDLMESASAANFNDTMGVFLSDLFSMNWMSYVQYQPIWKTSLHQLFQDIRYEIDTSHIEEFGDLDIGNTIASKIFGNPQQVSNQKSSRTTHEHSKLNAVAQTEVKLAGLRISLKKAIKLGNATEIGNLKKMTSNEILKRLEHMKKMDKILRKITNGDADKIKVLESTLLRSPNTEAKKCYHVVLKDYFTSCLNFPENEFMYVFLKYFLSACNVQWTTAERIQSAIHSVCRNQIYNTYM